jgi:hypothetical protein
MLFKQSTVLFVLAAAAPLGCHGFGVLPTTVQQRTAPLQAKKQQSYDNEDAIMNAVKNIAAAASIMGVVSASGSAAFAAPTIPARSMGA